MKYLFISAFLCSASLLAQGPQTPVVAGAVTLGSSCIPNSPFYANLSNGLMASCQNNGTSWAWTLVNVTQGVGSLSITGFTGIPKAISGSPILQLAGPADYPAFLQSFLTVTATQPPYNACGNGVCDDTAALTSACAAVLSTHGTLFLPAGRYSADTLGCINTYGITIAGAGPEATFLLSRYGNDNVRINTGNQVHSVIIRDLNLGGGAGVGNIGINTNGAFPSLMEIHRVTIATDGQCIYMPYEFTVVVDKVSCKSFSNNGIEIAGDNTSILMNNYVHQVGAGKAAYVVYGGGTTFLNNNGINSVGGAPIPNSTWAIVGRNNADGDPVIIGPPTTYVSGGSPAGTGYCVLAAANGGGTGGTVYMYLSAGTVTGFLVQFGGANYTSEPTLWNPTSGSGTGTCSGSVTTSGGTLVPQLYASVNFIGNNHEDFAKYGVWIKGGSIANFYGSTFLAYAGTTTDAIYSDNATAVGVPVIDAATNFTTIGAWNNGYAIHGGTSCTLWLDQSRNSTPQTSGNCWSDSLGIAYPNATLSRTNFQGNISALNAPNLSAQNMYEGHRIGTLNPGKTKPTVNPSFPFGTGAVITGTDASGSVTVGTGATGTVGQIVWSTPYTSANVMCNVHNQKTVGTETANVSVAAVSGNVSVVSWVSGPTFNTNWLAQMPIILAAGGAVGTLNNQVIGAVSSTTSMTISPGVASPIAAATLYLPSRDQSMNYFAGTSFLNIYSIYGFVPGDVIVWSCSGY